MKKIFKDISHLNSNQHCPFCKKECVYNKEYLMIECIDCYWIYNEHTFCIVNQNYKLSLIFIHDDINKVCVNLNVIRGVYTPSYYYLHENVLLESKEHNYSEYKSYLIDYYLSYSENILFM